MSVNPNLPVNSVWNKIVKTEKNMDLNENKSVNCFEESNKKQIVPKLGFFTSKSKNKLYEGKMVTPKVNSYLRSRMYLENKSLNYFNDDVYEELDSKEKKYFDKNYNVNIITSDKVPDYINKELYTYSVENYEVGIYEESDDESLSDYDYSSDDYSSSDEEVEYLDMSYDY